MNHTFATTSHLNLIETIYKNSPTFFRHTEGLDFLDGLAVSDLTSYPPGIENQKYKKHFLIIHDDQNQPFAVVDIIFGYPQLDTAFIWPTSS